VVAGVSRCIRPGTRGTGGGRWYENGEWRQCQSVSEAGLAARLEKVTVRLAADPPGMERPGAELIETRRRGGTRPAKASLALA
jgi:hypothetical protein